jgi:hypothetical protein
MFLFLINSWDAVTLNVMTLGIMTLKMITLNAKCH